MFGNGSHILYVNGKYCGDDEIGKLIRDLSCTDPDDMNYEALADRARYYKKNEKGVTAMCKIMEDMRNEVAREAAIEAEQKSAREIAERMIRGGEMPLEKIARYVPTISLEELKKLEAEIMQLV